MNQKRSKQQNKLIGDLGEQIACQYLIDRGFSIQERNYWRKWGEIDIVARGTTQSQPIVHFVEVKTVSYETRAALEQAVTRDTWRPEENVHQFKLHQIHKALETWIVDNTYD